MNSSQSSSHGSDNTQLVPSSTENSRTQFVSLIRFGHGRNFYEILGFQKGSAPSAQEIARAFRKQSRFFHPDKHEAAAKEECEVIIHALEAARRILSEPRLKAAYDKELKIQDVNEEAYNTWRWYTRWCCNIMKCAAGLGCVAGFLTVAGLPYLVTGALGLALLQSAVKASLVLYINPDLPDGEYTKESIVGAVQGLGTAAAAACCAPATVLGVATMGAGIGALHQLTQDTVDWCTGYGHFEDCYDTLSMFGSALVGAVTGIVVQVNIQPLVSDLKLAIDGGNMAEQTGEKATARP